MLDQIREALAAYEPKRIERDDLEGLEHLEYLPGMPPYLGGPYTTMYARRPWTPRQYAGFSTAEDSNAFYRRNLAMGQQGLSIAFDLPTHRGYDIDHERVGGAVGMAAVPLASVLDLPSLLVRTPLARGPVAVDQGGTAPHPRLVPRGNGHRGSCHLVAGDGSWTGRDRAALEFRS